MDLIGTEVRDGGKAVALTWRDGMTARFHAIWLRDNALDGETRDPGNGQRRITLADIPQTIAVVCANVQGDSLAVEFDTGEQAVFPAQWLRDRNYDKAVATAPFDPELQLWSGDHKVHSGEISELENDRAGLHRWLNGVRRHGVARVSGLAAEPGALQRVVDLFGYIRETNYGRWFDVRTEVNPTNLAYTNLGLQAHTDNPYRDPVPGLQVLSCVENSVHGGESAVVDGFRAIDILRRENPGWFDVLAGYPARFEYAGSDGVRLTSKRPVIECGPDGQVMAIRFNNRSMAANTDVPFERMETWYDALRRLGDIVDDAGQAVTFRLDPGEAFIVDNTRVLHARTAFSGSGQRWLQGCYADRDSLLSELAVTGAE